MSGKSRLLYELMLRKGYPEEFSRLICAEMSTDFTAEKMMSYVSGPKKRLEDVADEMVAIQDHNCVIISYRLSSRIDPLLRSVLTHLSIHSSGYLRRVISICQS